MGADSPAENTPNASKNFSPKCLLKLKLSLGVRSPWLQKRNVLSCCGLHIGRAYLHIVARGFKSRILILKTIDKYFQKS